jgi:endogenous inhibitor of DNA gyrase (YacG/DUF329 family)
VDLPRSRAEAPKFSCPTCGKRFSPEQSPVMPFCSRRCQQIDLGRWFNEEIGLPVEGSDPDEEVDEGFPN